MALPRLIKWSLWTLIAICVIVGLSVLLLFTETAQTYIAHYFVDDLNKSLNGKIEFASVHVGLEGELILTELSIRDSLDNEIIGLSKLRVTADLWGLTAERIHIHSLKLSGLRARFEMDSTGNNLAAIFASKPAPVDSSTGKAFDWPITVDQIEIEGSRTTLQIDQAILLDLDSWQLDASGGFIDKLITYDLKLKAEQGISLDAAGTMLLTDKLPEVKTKLEATIDSLILAHLPEPAPRFGDIHLNTTASLSGDSLDTEFVFTSSSVGSVSGQTLLLDLDRSFFGNGDLLFEHLNIAPVIEDTIASDLNGSLTFTKAQTNDFVNGWNAQLKLDSSSIMNESLSTNLTIRTQDSTAWIEGDLQSNYGEAKLDLTIGGFDPATMSAAGDLSITNVRLHHFISEVPDSLNPLNGRITLDFPSLNPDSLVGQSCLRLNQLQLGRHRLDSAVVYAHIDRSQFEIDTLRLLLDDIRVDGSLHGTLGERVEFDLNGVIPELADIGELLQSFDVELDSVSGSLFWDLSGDASLAGDSLSQLTVLGDVRLANAAYGSYTVAEAGLRITDYQLDNNEFSGVLDAKGILIAEQLLDSVKVIAHGNPADIHTSVKLWALSDTLYIDAEFDTRIDEDDISITLEQLIARTFGAEWKSAYPSDITIIGDRIEIDGVQVSSPYGVLRAVGYVQAEGEQDLTLELSGFQIQTIAEFVDADLPVADVDIRLQITGTDTALTGDIAVTVDSMTYNGNLISDEFYLFANILHDQISIEGFSTWYEDTLVIFGGQLPARISFDDGFVLRETDSLAGNVRIFEQPLDRLNPWLEVGTKSGGLLSAEMNIQGTPANPEWEGFFSVRDGYYSDPKLGVQYKYIVLDGKLHGDSLIINQFRATSKGTLSGSGYAIMGFPLPERLNLDIKFDRFTAQNSPRQKARLSGNTTITGPLDSLNVQGNLKIEELLYRITQATSKEIETIDLETYLAKLRGDSIAENGFVLDDLYRGMSHDLRIEIPGNCWIRGGGINIELLGDLTLFKEKNADPVVDGEIKVKRGTVEFAGRELKVETGSVQFDGPIDDPILDIVAVDQKILRMEGARISIHMYGPVSNTRLDFSGTLADGTALTREETAAALLRGTTASGGGSIDLNESAANIAAAPVTKLIEKSSGLDVFQYRAGEGGINNLSSGSLEVGTYLTDRLFIRVLQPIETIQSGQEVSIEYQLKEWLKLIAEQKGHEQSAFDVYVQLEWR